MASVTDDRGYNQGFAPTRALEVRTARRADALISEMDLSRPRDILELGCGTGELSHLLAARTGARVTGVDLCRPFVEQARERFPLEGLAFETLDLRDAAALGRWAGRFDYVVGNGILHHLYADLDASLGRIRELLKPGGKIAFWEPNLLNPYVLAIFKLGWARKRARLEPDEMAFTADFITRKLENAGFSRPRAEQRDYLLPNTPDALIGAAIRLGEWLEQVPWLSWSAQSLFVVAGRQEPSE